MNLTRRLLALEKGEARAGRECACTPPLVVYGPPMGGHPPAPPPSACPRCRRGRVVVAVVYEGLPPPEPEASAAEAA